MFGHINVEGVGGVIEAAIESLVSLFALSSHYILVEYVAALIERLPVMAHYNQSVGWPNSRAILDAVSLEVV
ncbi:hypothetical protein TWF481_010407 [Arthrobotrys musiformis]|uniref:Uncharacterized protein n=1 Tax=Arthrobotrys musiformis TaxID=47236 RepID=A0AAV9W0V8_9PEZI